MLMCRDLAVVASDYIDGELSPGQRLSVKVHLMMCRHCRALVNNLRNSATVLQKHSSQQVNEDYFRRVKLNIAQALQDSRDKNS
ncbi:zf-HC2 domain-containing protein [Marinobacter sp. BGYM27]|uniref:anti-sigma factor family protein n=1 Tax=unclassified Marinobacter TaxID=83889 RepID=UPI0021A3BF83|nr:zf-HC2 domain-containing protein [Marinobacter sp. BGYM27]MDG5500119.1 zf-HC2 domain-containing protein [Marinobacter sp. BGYM27]